MRKESNSDGEKAGYKMENLMTNYLSSKKRKRSDKICKEKEVI